MSLLGLGLEAWEAQGHLREAPRVTGSTEGPTQLSFYYVYSQAFLQDLCGREGRKGDNNLT